MSLRCALRRSEPNAAADRETEPQPSRRAHPPPPKGTGGAVQHAADGTEPQPSPRAHPPPPKGAGGAVQHATAGAVPQPSPRAPPPVPPPQNTGGAVRRRAGPGLATLGRASCFLPFGEALAVAQSLGLASVKKWRAWCKEGMCPHDVPRGPDRTYKDGGWQGWGHWLGTGNTRNTTPFLPFGEALAVAQSLGLGSAREWHVWCKAGRRPPNVPSLPPSTYKGRGWQGWGHWLGTGNQSSNEFLPFGEALAVARSLGLASSTEWRVWCKEGMRPPEVPSCPHAAYKDGGWQGWGHWLGTGNVHPTKRQFLPFEEAREVARSLGLANLEEWNAWCKEGMCPPSVPRCPGESYNVPAASTAAPNTIYAHDGWAGWAHWLHHGAAAQSAVSLAGPAHAHVAANNSAAPPPVARQRRAQAEEAPGGAAARVAHAAAAGSSAGPARKRRKVQQT